MTQAEAIIKALLARGEREVTSNSASKFRKFTRQFYGTRGTLNELRNVAEKEASAHWFVGRNGSLRVGRTSAGSQRVKETIKEVLINEGRDK